MAWRSHISNIGFQPYSLPTEISLDFAKIYRHYIYVEEHYTEIGHNLQTGFLQIN